VRTNFAVAATLVAVEVEAVVVFLVLLLFRRLCR